MFLRLRVTQVFLMALTVTNLLSSPGAADKPARGHEPGKHHERFVAWMEKELSLSPVQAAQVREILQSDTLVMEHFEMGMGAGPHHGRRPGAPHGGMFPFGEEFLDQLKADKVDTAALAQGFNERQQRMRARHDKMVFKFAQVHGVLTRAQRLKLADLLERRRAEHREKAEKESHKK
jgi:Spy/CpxP family protein refolding chaperone